MRVRDWICAGILGMVIGGCAGMQGTVNSGTRAAIAPTGKLRVAFISVPIYATKDSATGELKGVAVDLGKELAQRIGLPFHPVVYSNPAALIGGAKSGEWDVALMGINAERAAVMDFSSPFMEVEHGYLVRADLPVATTSDMDKLGIRIGVFEKSGADLVLSRTLKNAVLVRTASVPELFSMIGSGKSDAIAGTKTGLFGVVTKQPNTRVLDGRILIEPTGMGVPKGRDPAAAAYVGKFVEEAKVEGLVKSAIERAGLRGVVVAPLK